ncbi:MAG TPA: sugar transferase, partial [Acidobacteriota bacterium]
LLTELAEDLAREHGCRISVVAGLPLDRKNQVQPLRWLPFRRESRNGVEIYRAAGTTFSTKRFAGRAANYISYFLSACLASFWIRRPDIVVALTDPPIVGLAAYLTARRCGGRFVFLCQDIFPEVAALLEDFHNERVNRCLDRVNRFLIKRADRVVALGDTMRERLVIRKGAEPEKVSVIHNWADCQGIVPGSKKNSFSIAYRLSEKFVVMHSGNMGLSQSLDTVLDAAGRLKHIPDLVFALVGDGSKRASLEAKTQSRGLTNVRFFPYQPKDRLKDSFASADVFLISLKRGLAGYIVPSKLYGILAAGRPYIAAVEDATEVASITREYDCGLLAELGDPDDLARKILTLYYDHTLAERLGRNARRAALEFDRSKQIRAYFDLFHQLGTSNAIPSRAREQADPRSIKSKTARALQLGVSACLRARLSILSYSLTVAARIFSRKLAVPGVEVASPAPLLKRPFDVLLSGIGLVLSAPLWGLIALSIKLEDGGPVFYGQKRVGEGGQLFQSWKFRSMIPDSDQKFGPLQADERDTRVTKVGRILRATAMDELPQLWNIFVGDMSFVGPRALMPQEIEVKGTQDPVPLEKVPGYEARHRVKPGLTGVAQVFAARDIPRREKFRLDLLYIKKQTFLLDLKLIALSFWITFRGKWEYRGRKL